MIGEHFILKIWNNILQNVLRSLDYQHLIAMICYNIYRLPKQKEWFRFCDRPPKWYRTIVLNCRAIIFFWTFSLCWGFLFFKFTLCISPETYHLKVVHTYEHNWRTGVCSKSSCLHYFQVIRMKCVLMTWFSNSNLKVVIWLGKHFWWREIL